MKNVLQFEHDIYSRWPIKLFSEITFGYYFTDKIIINFAVFLYFNNETYYKMHLQDASLIHN